MRKLILWVIGIVVVVIVLSRADDLALLVTTLKTGALIPLLVAALFEVSKFFSQAFAVSAAFEATGAKRNPIKLLPVVFSAMFVNSLAPSGGTAGTLLYIEDARRDGVSIARSTPAILLYDIAYFVGFLLIMVIGFVVLASTNALSPYLVLAGFLVVLIVLGFITILLLGWKWPDKLLRLARWLERKANSVLTKRLHRHALDPWADKIAENFSEASTSIAGAPKPALTAVGFMTLTAGFDMLAMTAIGFAFGFNNVPLLLGCYVTAQLLTIISPTPQGVGIVEAAIALLIASFGASASIATAISLVYRGYVYWIPFLIGAIALRRTKLFTPSKPPSDEQKDRDHAHIIALVVAVVSILLVLFAILPAAPGAWDAVAQFMLNGTVISSTSVVLSAIVLLFLSHGLYMRSRTSWALAMIALILSAILLLSSGRGLRIAVIPIALAVWLFVKRRVFHNATAVKRKGIRKYSSIAFAVAVALLYGIVGYMILDDFPQVTSIPAALFATLQAFVPFGPVPPTETIHGMWFTSSVRVVEWFAIIYAVASIVYSRFGERIFAKIPWWNNGEAEEAVEPSGLMIEDETSNSLSELFDEDGNLVTDSAVEVSAGSAEDEEA